MVTVTPAEGVVNLLKAGRLLPLLVVCGAGSVVCLVGTKGKGRTEEGPSGASPWVSRAPVVCGIGSVVVVIAVVVLLGRKGGRMGRNLFLNLNLFRWFPNGRLKGFSSLSLSSLTTWLAFVPNPDSFRSPDVRSASVTSAISLSSTSPSSSRIGTTVSNSIGRVVVDLLLAKILFLIEFLKIPVLTFGVERMEETVVERAKPGLLGRSPGLLPNSGLLVALVAWVA